MDNNNNPPSTRVRREQRAVEPSAASAAFGCISTTYTAILKEPSMLEFYPTNGSLKTDRERRPKGGKEIKVWKKTDGNRQASVNVVQDGETLVKNMAPYKAYTSRARLAACV